MINQDGDGLLDIPPMPGWSGTEYNGFITLPMYNAGRNNDGSPQIGNSFVGYDCVTGKLCVAAYLLQPYLDDNGCSIVIDSASSWISINGDKDFFVPNTNDPPNSMYVKLPPDSSFPGGRPISKKGRHNIGICY